jgi:hypothetical protein
MHDLLQCKVVYSPVCVRCAADARRACELGSLKVGPGSLGEDHAATIVPVVMRVDEGGEPAPIVTARARLIHTTVVIWCSCVTNQPSANLPFQWDLDLIF